MKFSSLEKEHLLRAWIAISFAFTLLYENIFSIGFIVYFAMSLFTVGMAFLLHELAHKYVAQRYGCWAEFRTDNRMLLFAIFSAFLGFLFAAPGAVFIQGRVTTESNGKISLAGPLTNLILATGFIALSLFAPAGILATVFLFSYQINSFIALFNMLPFFNLDGAKILRWSKAVYAATLVYAIILQLPIPELLVKLF